MATARVVPRASLLGTTLQDTPEELITPDIKSCSDPNRGMETFPAPQGQTIDDLILADPIGPGIELPNVFLAEEIITGDKNSKYGSYTIIFKSGTKYHGKGPLSRARESARYRSKQNNDKVVTIEWNEASSNVEAFIQKALRMLNDDGDTYNVRKSPGQKYLDEKD